MEQANELNMRKAIVISAVNLNRGGTLRILRDCLAYLSVSNENETYRIVAVVYDKSLCDFPNIEYIETKWPKKRWTNRLWFEYISLRKISEDLQPVALWLSLHDTSPSVVADRRAVYCHNSFPFLKWNLRDIFFAPKIVLFALFSKFFYRINIHQNSYVIVQQEWFRQAFVKLFKLNTEKIIVSPPSLDTASPLPSKTLRPNASPNDSYTFLYPAIADSHKNFECICRAADILQQWGVRNFKVLLTIKGDENRYAKWLFENWGRDNPAIEFLGYLDRETLFNYYKAVDSLIFASKVETWGLPISEFAQFQKPMLLADLAYARETAQGNSNIAFFSEEDAKQLAEKMQKLIDGDRSFLQYIEKKEIAEPKVGSWEALFDFLLKN